MDNLKEILRNATDPAIVQERVAARKKQLQGLGFDTDGVYSTENYHILVSEDDLMAEEDEWNQFISDFNMHVSAAKPSPAIEDMEVIVEEEEIIDANEIDAADPLTQDQAMVRNILLSFKEFCESNNKPFTTKSIDEFVKKID